MISMNVGNLVLYKQHTERESLGDECVCAYEAEQID